MEDLLKKGVFTSTDDIKNIDFKNSDVCGRFGDVSVDFYPVSHEDQVSYTTDFVLKQLGLDLDTASLSDLKRVYPSLFDAGRFKLDTELVDNEVAPFGTVVWKSGETLLKNQPHRVFCALGMNLMRDYRSYSGFYENRPNKPANAHLLNDVWTSVPVLCNLKVERVDK